MEAAARGAKFILVGTKALFVSRVRVMSARSVTPQEQARPIVRKYGQEAGIHYTDMKSSCHGFSQVCPQRDLGSSFDTLPV